ncbi:hypothetical protein M758_1G187900 [Ceratodon purpureus]|nr:hypothetical protein M758_1G187900 [Ceratodon purpureus]
MMTRFLSLFTRPLLVTYFYLFLYIGLSSGVILYNKWVLSDRLYGFHYPISLTMMHMGFSAVVAFILVRIFKVVERVEMTFSIYMTCVVPISAFFAVSLWFSNTAYLYISVAFIQMLKALMPVATFFMAVLCRTDKPRCDIFWNMVLISAGVIIASMGEVHFNIIGFIFQIAGILAEALRLVLTQVLLQKKGLSLNPITSLYYIAPCSFFFLAIPWAFLERPMMMDAEVVKFDIWIFGSNALCALALNLAVFLVIGRTGAITVRVAGVIKDWILIGLSTVLFPDSQISVMNAVGYSVALSGVVLYNYLKAKEAKAAVTLPTDAPPEKKPLTAKERKLERKSSDLTIFENTEGKEMAVLPTLLDDAVDEEAPLLVPSASFNERSLEEPLVIRSTYDSK